MVQPADKTCERKGGNFIGQVLPTKTHSRSQATAGTLLASPSFGGRRAAASDWRFAPGPGLRSGWACVKLDRVLPVS